MRLNALLTLSLPAALVFAIACGGGVEPTVAGAPKAQPTSAAQPTATQVVIPTVAPLVPTATPEPAKPTPVPTATATAAPVGPSGTLNVAVALITPANFLASKIPWPGNLNIVAFGVGEGLVQADYAEPPLIGQLNKNGIASNWVVAPDLSKITFTIRRGVKFHRGYGELTAQDVAFSLNDPIKPGSTWARVEMGDFLDKAVAVDAQTLDFVFKKWNATWYGWMY
ncbi:MAG: hypothetical protein HY682_03780, partial [Chloroflexi bacterium]|nr:hypothetical protein [Chloroflexota bacterium]